MGRINQSVSGNFAIKVVSKIAKIVLDYLKFFPLGFVFCYATTVILTLVTSTPFEETFLKLVGVSLGEKTDTYNLDSKNITNMFLPWWLIGGTILEILSLLIKVRFKRIYTTTALAITLLFLTLGAMEKLGDESTAILWVLYAVSVLCLLMYFVFAKMTDTLMYTRNYVKENPVKKTTLEQKQDAQ
ncbi:hypothetical protein JXA34_02105 [Patescibacteria group bacterium]|nr:hypothetical protein [Patescibacteria group bacterium]